MPDVEKVLKGLEICKEESKLCFGESECGYQSYFPRCWITLAADALALLKAQEPVEPVIETHWETPSVYDEDVKVTENKCGACGTEIDKWDKYFRACGRAVKW